MNTLPQLTEEDLLEFNTTLKWILGKTRATAAIIADKGGFLLAHQGGSEELDLTTVAALASGAFMATQTIAGLISDVQFDSVSQQGHRSSLFIRSVDEFCLLLVIHPPEVAVGAVKYFAAEAIRRIARQMEIAHNRAPSEGLDLSVLNVENPVELFKKPLHG